jgi:hypothetical protein
MKLLARRGRCERKWTRNHCDSAVRSAVECLVGLCANDDANVYDQDTIARTKLNGATHTTTRRRENELSTLEGLVRTRVYSQCLEQTSMLARHT